ncbi:MAG TPA: PilZ domain-containing protein [Rhodanobacteraceae bacterium]|nr:PilZ domain-containing protein [Oleiagrimonas sp.]HET9819533.1 PilZ domain-containing protein [Rhodanobacteraceae bacterium]
MTHDPWQFFGDRITWEGAMRVECETLDAPLDPARQARMEEQDADVLATLNMLGERGGSEPPEDEAVSAALARIDAKLDLLLAMFNRYLLGHVQMPPPRTVRFNARGIVIPDWKAPEADMAVLVRIYFDSCVGMPLELPGRVAPAPRGAGGFVAFDELDEGIRQSIEHLVFRQHRRQLAESRREPQPPQQ